MLNSLDKDKTTLIVSLMLAFMVSFHSINAAWFVGIGVYIFLSFVQRRPNNAWDEDQL